jgi:SAM-dependent methyltransferase
VSLSEEHVRLAYRLFLGRNPENGTVVTEKTSLPSLEILGREFAQSREFLTLNRLGPADTRAVFSGLEPGQSIEWDIPKVERDPLWRHLASCWTELGRSEPYWSVISADRYRGRHEGQLDDENVFYNSGSYQVQLIEAAIRRAGIDGSRLKTCIEYGCGVGRVTRHLAGRFTLVHGYDISSPHLDIARRYLESESIDNVRLHHMTDESVFDAMPAVDLIVSIIVLQHSPPPIIACALDRMLARILPGGMAIIQLPTYISGYQYSNSAYLRAIAVSGNTPRIEIHALPQQAIFRIAAHAGCEILEVFEDAHIGYRTGERSNTFVIARSTGVV